MEKVKQISPGAGLERKQKGNRKEIERKEKKQEMKNKENGKSIQEISTGAGLERKQKGN